MKLRLMPFVTVLTVVSIAAAAPAAVADPSCAARATVRQTGMKSNEDGTRTVRYRAEVFADREAAQCTKVSLMVMRSYVKADGAVLEEAIPYTLEVRDRSQIEGEDVLATQKLVYWWTDRVTCEPCATEAAAPSSKPQRSKKEPAVKRESFGENTGGGRSGKKTVFGMVGAVALGVLLVL